MREDLREEFNEFQADYAAWEARSAETGESLMEFVDNFLSSEVPEDDNFHLVIMDGEFYRSNPRVVPSIIEHDSQIVQQLLTVQQTVETSITISDPAVGSVIYKTFVLRSEGVPVGLFVAVHLSAGERAESLTGVYVFIQVATIVVVVAFLLAWLGSHQLLKPVQQLAETAREINERNLSQRLDVNGSGELAELAITFNTMMDRVQSAFDSQRNFINDAGHELRTPLTIIQGHLELLVEDPTEQQETLTIVIDELDRMSRFVNDLILLAKAEQTDFLQPESIDVKTFTEEVFRKVTVLAADRQWQLESLGQGTFVGDRQRITGALINLAQNSIQHTQIDDTIELGSCIAGRTVRFWVSDNGEGISFADQERIFDRFARAANSYRRSEGAGLGLAIVKAIVDSHRGRIDLTSRLGVGTTFALAFPLELPEE